MSAERSAEPEREAIAANGSPPSQAARRPWRTPHVIVTSHAGSAQATINTADDGSLSIS